MTSPKSTPRITEFYRQIDTAIGMLAPWHAMILSTENPEDDPTFQGGQQHVFAVVCKQNGAAAPKLRWIEGNAHEPVLFKPHTGAQWCGEGIVKRGAFKDQLNNWKTRIDFLRTALNPPIAPEQSADDLNQRARDLVNDLIGGDISHFCIISPK